MLTIEHGSVGYSHDHVLAKNIQLPIQRGQRVAIIGANGIGKSTLLKTIVGHIPPISGTFQTGHQVDIAYFAQEQVRILDKNKTILDNVLMQASATTEKQARQVLGSFLFRGDEVYKPVYLSSGGEVCWACLFII